MQGYVGLEIGLVDCVEGKVIEKRFGILTPGIFAMVWSIPFVGTSVAPYDSML